MPSRDILVVHEPSPPTTRQARTCARARAHTWSDSARQRQTASDNSPPTHFLQVREHPSMCCTRREAPLTDVASVSQKSRTGVLRAEPTAASIARTSAPPLRENCGTVEDRGPQGTANASIKSARAVRGCHTGRSQHIREKAALRYLRWMLLSLTMHARPLTTFWIESAADLWHASWCFRRRRPYDPTRARSPEPTSPREEPPEVSSSDSCRTSKPPRLRTSGLSLATPPHRTPTEACQSCASRCAQDRHSNKGGKISILRARSTEQWHSCS